jgi:hypothetical protein
MKETIKHCKHQFKFIVMNCLWVLTILVQQHVEQHWLVDMTASIHAEIAIPELKVDLLRTNMEFVTLHVEDHTRLAVMDAKLHAMAICHVLFV